MKQVIKSYIFLLIFTQSDLLHRKLHNIKMEEDDRRVKTNISMSHSLFVSKYILVYSE